MARPIPSPSAFVVYSGSNRRSTSFTSMPVPESSTAVARTGRGGHELSTRLGLTDSSAPAPRKDRALIYKIYVILFIYIRVLIKESAMNTMLRWSPTRQFHFHHDGDNQFDRFLGRATDDVDQGSSWLPAAEGRIEDGTYVIQLALPGVDPKDVKVTLMDNVLTVKGESKADHDTTGKDYF